jgi:hypothetical protein
VHASETPSGRLSLRTRWEAGLLAAGPAAAAAAWLWINEPDAGGVVQIGIGVMLVAVPFLAQTRRGFVISGVAIAGVLAFLLLLAMVLGLFLFFPAAAMLLAAAGVTAQEGPARVLARITAWLLAAAIVAGFAAAVRSYYFPSSDKIIVQLAAPETVAEELRLSQALQDAGFTREGVSTWTSSRQLAVEAAGLPARQRPRLLQLVRAQPGVVTAYWCEGTQCYN